MSDGGPAFPYGGFEPTPGVGNVPVIYADNHGMSLRDYFAAKALQGCFAYWGQMLAITKQDLGDPDPEKVTRIAYEYADAMLKAREE